MVGCAGQQVIAWPGRLELLQAEGVVDRLVAGLTRHSHEQWLRMEALHA